MLELTVTAAEPFAAPPVEKCTPELEVFGDGHDQVSVVEPPVNTVVGSAVNVGGNGVAAHVLRVVVHGYHAGGSFTYTPSRQ